MTKPSNTEEVDRFNKLITSINLFGSDSAFNNKSFLDTAFNNYKNDLNIIYETHNQLGRLDTNVVTNPNNTIPLLNNKLTTEEIIKKRQVQMNVYYIKRYYKQIGILKQIIFFCCLGLIGFILYNYGILSEKILVLYIGSLLAILFVKVLYDLWDLYIRDDKNFDEYDFSIYGNGQKTSDNPDLIEISSNEDKNLTKKCVKKT
jgi:hypothetical protein